MKPAPFEYKRPESLDAAIALLGASDGRARLLAGGQSLGPMLNLRLVRSDLLIDISRLTELRGVIEDDDALTVGAALTHAAFEDGDVPDVAKGLLRRTAAGIAYRAVRNRGTIGGSLAHADPAADWPPVLMALGTMLNVRGQKGQREVPADALISAPLTTNLAPNEVLESIRIPRLSPTARWGHRKVTRQPGDFAESLAVVVFDPNRGMARAVLGSPTHPPVLLDQTAQAIAGRRVADLRDAALADITANAVCDEADDYALDLHSVVVARAALEALS